MSDKNEKEIDKTSPSYNESYEEGYKSKDYTWGDGWVDAITKWGTKSDDHDEAYAQGERDRMRDDVQRDKKQDD